MVIIKQRCPRPHLFPVIDFDLYRRIYFPSGHLSHDGGWTGVGLEVDASVGTTTEAEAVAVGIDATSVG